MRCLWVNNGSRRRNKANWVRGMSNKANLEGAAALVLALSAPVSAALEAFHRRLDRSFDVRVKSAKCNAGDRPGEFAYLNFPDEVEDK